LHSLVRLGLVQDMKGGEMGNRYRLKNGDVAQVVQIEQDFNSRHHGKWVLRSDRTGRRLHRTQRQLRNLERVS
jgi:hypothetical protein